MNLRLLISALLLAAASPPFAADTNILKNSRTGPFILGAEVSWAPEDEADGAEYFDHGVKKDIFEILKEYKFNYIWLRLFVNPSSTNGYARRRPEAFCDLEHVKALAKRAKTAGMGILLDNRVAIRSTLTPGTVTLTATRDGLEPAKIQIASKPVEIQDGLAH